MLIDETKYRWKRGKPVDMELTEQAREYPFDSVLRIYLFEGEGTVRIYADAERENLLYAGGLPYEPEKPIACDGLTFALESEPFAIRLIAESGESKDALDPYLNTSDGMTAVSSSYSDDGSFQTDGLSGFKFNGTAAETVYISSNHWIGFGTSSEQLKVLRRDGCSTAVYRQTGTCADGVEFLKIRFEGYTVYNGRTDANRLIFELFLLSNNDMLLNVIQTPTSGNTGTSELVCGKTATPLILADPSGEGKGTRVSFYHLDEDGNEWRVDYSRYELPDSDEPYFLLRKDGELYAVADGELTATSIRTLTAAAFMKHGSSAPPSSELLTALESPEIFCWKSAGKEPKLKDKMVAYPHPQAIASRVDMSHESILGIKMMTAEYSGNLTVSRSADGGGSFTQEQPMADFLNLDPAELYGSLGEKKLLILRFVLHGDAAISRFKITYEN